MKFRFFFVLFLWFCIIHQISCKRRGRGHNSGPGNIGGGSSGSSNNGNSNIGIGNGNGGYTPINGGNTDPNSGNNGNNGNSGGSYGGTGGANSNTNSTIVDDGEEDFMYYSENPRSRFVPETTPNGCDAACGSQIFGAVFGVFASIVVIVMVVRFRKMKKSQNGVAPIPITTTELPTLNPPYPSPLPIVFERPKFGFDNFLIGPGLTTHSLGENVIITNSDYATSMAKGNGILFAQQPYFEITLRTHLLIGGVTIGIKRHASDDRSMLAGYCSNGNVTAPTTGGAPLLNFPFCSEGDTMGCGVRFSLDGIWCQLYFTKNGEKFGDLCTLSAQECLVPFVILEGHESVEVNLKGPFMFGGQDSMVLPQAFGDSNAYLTPI